MKRLLLTVSVLALASAVAGNKANPDAIELKPIPVPITFKSNIDAPVAFDANTKVVVECADAEGTAWLNRRFKEWYGAYAPTAVAGTAGLELRAGDEAYAVAVDTSGVKIAARTLAGVRWAAYSLRPCAIAKRGTVTTAGYLLPTLTISDAPHLAFRGIHLCCLPEIRLTQIERSIRLAAMMKFNYVVLELWGDYKSEKHPWWSWPNAKVTKTELRRLVALGRELGVTLIPQVPTFGHAGSSRTDSLKHNVLDLQPQYEPLFEPGGWNWCLTNPETQRILRELIDEFLEVFDHPPYIHLGCDEAQPPACPECRKRPYDELVCEHIANLAAFAKSRGARAMIWHDMLLDRNDPRWKGFVRSGSKQTAKLADTLPKDVIICDWQYSYGKMHEVRKDWPTIQHFHDKGFPVVGCPWQNYNTMKPMADFVAKIGGFGFLETTWHHLRERDWNAMYRYSASAAWGTPVGRVARHGPTPQYDTLFGNMLRMVGHDMKVKDYRDTGNVDHQLPPSWWIDN